MQLGTKRVLVPKTYSPPNPSARMILGMQLSGTTSWATSTDEPLMLLLALYVRDASGLHPHLESDIPALEPAVLPDISSPAPEDVALNQWEAWWHEILEGGGLWPENVDPHDFANVRGDPPDSQTPLLALAICRTRLFGFGREP